MTAMLYEFTVLRYIHDPVSQESLNIGVLVYCREAEFLQLLAMSRYSRLSSAFHGFNGLSYRRIIQKLESVTTRVAQQIFSNDWTTPPPDRLAELLPQIMRPDDSSFVFGSIGGGLTNEPAMSLQSLYDRMVVLYAEGEDEDTRRNEEAIWQIFADQLQRKSLYNELQPAVISTPTFKYEFNFAWKNERWHPLEPLSFDLKKPASISNKASRWIGNISILRESKDLGTVYFLIGKPESASPDIERAYRNALINMQKRIPNAKFYIEDDAEEFAEGLAKEIGSHEKEQPNQ